jgi:L-aspartate oxidase
MAPLRTRELPRAPAGVRVNIEDVIYSLKSLMWRQMGVERSRAGMEDALEKTGFWSRAVGDLGSSDPRSWELVNMLTVARLATFGALAREESRGVHFRLDFPDTRPEWRVHTILSPVLEGERIARVHLEREPVQDQLPVA